MQKINPCLWFDRNAEEAVNFYISIFKNSKILQMSHYGEGGHLPQGTVLTCKFLLDGQEFLALNGGPYEPYTAALSLCVNCDDQAEVDRLWDKLSSNGGEELQCGWLKDKYGVNWQIVPTILGQLISDPDPVKSGRVMKAIEPMKKLDIAKLEAAYNG